MQAASGGDDGDDDDDDVDVGEFFARISSGFPEQHAAATARRRRLDFVAMMSKDA